ncbi:MAG: agmatine deiminase family protein [Cytophagaceae bacterium]|jgi:agmatine/peptidylarginine deiminase|nr:agmatine deiminase family protein [Cytophagaceae bacterium]
MNNTICFPAEWTEQDAVLMALPHKATDWADMLGEVQNCFWEIINAITKHDEPVILLVPDRQNFDEAKHRFSEKVCPVIVPTNDTWARDFCPVFIYKDGVPVCLDFKFNGWGLKFAADKDNLISGTLACRNIFSEKSGYRNLLNFVLEGGSLESDGEGTLLTTAQCLLSPNRNGEWNRPQIETYLKEHLGLSRILWLNSGFLEGDDTDSHIDTLARFCDTETITYVKCSSPNDIHFEALANMEDELKKFCTPAGKPYRLLPLPMAEPVFFDGERLPATYANFLIVNKAVLVPTYNSPLDDEAIKIISSAFPDRKVVGVNCNALIKQHGSLHCVTMQLPKGSINPNFLA